MNRRMIYALFLGAGALRAAPPDPSAASEAAVLFSKHVKPLFTAKCQGCHGKTRISGLSVETREALLAGGKRGAAVVAGQPGRSLLVSAIEQTGDLKMPPGEKLPEETVARVRRWVDL